MKPYILVFSLLLSFLSANAQLGFCLGNSGDPIFIEDFGTGIGSTMLPVGTTTYTYIDALPDDGFYTVANSSFGNSFDWHEVEDHTPNDTDGKMLIVNAGFTAGEFYRTTVSGLCETTTYEFSAWLLNVLTSPSFCSGINAEIPVNVSFQIWDSTDSNLLASGDTGDIFASSDPTWLDYGLVFQTESNQDAVILKMINNGEGGCGNDLAIDDIEFKSCGDNVIVTDDLNNTSIVICSSDTAQTTTLTAIPDSIVFASHFYQWQQSADGNTWTDIAGETNETIEVSPAITTFYRTKVAEVADNLNNEQCILFADVFQIDVIPSPNAPISDGDVSFDCTLGEAVLSVSVSDNITVNWYDLETEGELLLADSITFTATDQATYYAESVDDITGCISSVRTAVSATGNLATEDCLVPQGISPGTSPGLNDRFDLSNFDVTKLEIYNRYGTLVYSKNDYTDEWEGQTNNGEALPVGTYFYVMIYEGGTKKRTSWVYLNR
ncbi:MAG: gliding motility-associated C-terminal domain-containing protein [Winogradskyella sp.]|nr:gliding motility-associated C-terminal domain-containing protein [Winogradskyella sp.]